MFELEKPDQNGITLREHLQEIERQTGKRPKELETPEFPFLMLDTWSAFISLSKTRTAGFNGPNPITYEQIKAWSELTGNPTNPRQVETILELDNLWLRKMNGTIG